MDKLKERKIVRVKVDTRRIWHTELNKCGSYGLTEKEATSMKSAWFWTRLIAWCFCGIPNCEAGVSLTLLLAVGALFLLWFSLFSLNMRAFALFYCILLWSVWPLSLRVLIFSEGKWNWGRERREEKMDEKLWSVSLQERRRRIYFHLKKKKKSRAFWLVLICSTKINFI